MPLFGHSSMLCSETMTQLGALSKPIACLTRVGSSTPTVSFSGRVCDRHKDNKAWVYAGIACSHETGWAILPLLASRRCLMRPEIIVTDH
jgi:hypothetical protein